MARQLNYRLCNLLIRIRRFHHPQRCILCYLQTPYLRRYCRSNDHLHPEQE